MKLTSVSIPATVGTIVLQMGTLPHAAIAKLTAEEIKQAKVAREAEYARINTQQGTDFVGAVREGVRDDGVQVLKGQAIFTGDLYAQLTEQGFMLVDIYTSDVDTNGTIKPRVSAVFSKTGEVNARVTSKAIDAVVSILVKNWYKCFIWLNQFAQVPNMTVNVFGHMEGGGASHLVMTRES